MKREILNHYLQFSQYTFPGCYQEKIKSSLPSEIKEIGLLVRKQIIHRVTLKNGNTGSNRDLRYGDMTKVPWYRQPEDDVFCTASAILAELYRRDPRGLILNRRTEDKLILTCRHLSVLMACLLKIKGIPARVRSGFAPYFEVVGLKSGKSYDHWLNQYWDSKKSVWVTIDVDGSLEGYLPFDSYNLSENTFDFSADAWLAIRQGKVKGDHFWNAGGHGGLVAVAWELFYDFHCLMNSEIIYLHVPEITFFKNFSLLSEKKLKEIDDLASLMQKPDANFEGLVNIWESKREYRLLKGGLL